jgi:hypothetical protein
MRIMAIALLAAAAFVLSAPSGSAAPAGGLVTMEEGSAAATPIRYVRRHGRSCYRKCYREFVIGRRVCRTYCTPF